MEIALYIVDIREELPEEENIAQEIAPFYKEKYYSIKARQTARHNDVDLAQLAGFQHLSVVAQLTVGIDVKNKFVAVFFLYQFRKHFNAFLIGMCGAFGLADPEGDSLTGASACGRGCGRASGCCAGAAPG